MKCLNLKQQTVYLQARFGIYVVYVLVSVIWRSLHGIENSVSRFTFNYRHFLIKETVNSRVTTDIGNMELWARG